LVGLASLRDTGHAALEAWNVLQSRQVLEWQEMAAAKTRLATRRESLLRVLRLRFPVALPQDLQTAIQETTDLDKLDLWFDAAVLAPSLDAFRVAVQS
jgi:hypothetical protein